VSIIDIVPTVLEAVGLPQDELLPGYSLRGELSAERVVGASKFSLYAHIQMPYKVRGYDGRASAVYNLVEDPQELTPITDSELSRELERDIRLKFEAELSAHPGFGAPPIPAEEEKQEMRDHLDALGYAGGEDSE